MSWSVEYTFLLLVSTSTTFVSGIMIERANTIHYKKIFVAISLAVNLGLLVLYKYYNFIGYSISSIMALLQIDYQVPKFNMLLPVGISFYTFQALSYTMDVYQGKIMATRHIGKYALFVSFFPQLVAGPIEKSASLLPQFNTFKSFNYERIKEGLILMAWGFFKKIVIADRLAMLVDTVYNNPTKYEGIELILATFFFAIQILCDFSGYTDIAIGAAKVFGFDLSKNFNRPYFSKSIPEFWRRWHISLGSWFRDYLYFPLGGSRVVQWKKYRNIMIVFLTSGIWHGASWNFLIWGFLHGVYQIVDVMITPLIKTTSKNWNLDLNGLPFKVFKIGLTFCLVTFAWIFFRANSLEDAYYIVKNLFKLNTEVFSENGIFTLGLDKTEFKIASISVLILLLANFLEIKFSLFEVLNKQHFIVRWTFYLFLIFYILIYGIYGTNEEAAFIYFQF